jgi:hypothetical protein
MGFFGDMVLLFALAAWTTILLSYSSHRSLDDRCAPHLAFSFEMGASQTFAQAGLESRSSVVSLLSI